MAVLLLFRALRRAHIVEARFRRVRVARCVPAFPARRCSSLSGWQALEAAAVCRGPWGCLPPIRRAFPAAGRVVFLSFVAFRQRLPCKTARFLCKREGRGESRGQCPRDRAPLTRETPRVSNGGYPENGKNGQIDEGGIMGYVCPPYIQIKKEEEFSPMALSADGVCFCIVCCPRCPPCPPRPPRPPCPPMGVFDIYMGNTALGGQQRTTGMGVGEFVVRPEKPDISRVSGLGGQGGQGGQQGGQIRVLVRRKRG